MGSSTRLSMQRSRDRCSRGCVSSAFPQTVATSSWKACTRCMPARRTTRPGRAVPAGVERERRSRDSRSSPPLGRYGARRNAASASRRAAAHFAHGGFDAGACSETISDDDVDLDDNRSAGIRSRRARRRRVDEAPQLVSIPGVEMSSDGSSRFGDSDCDMLRHVASMRDGFEVVKSSSWARSTIHGRTLTSTISDPNDRDGGLAALEQRFAIGEGAPYAAMIGLRPACSARSMSVDGPMFGRSSTQTSFCRTAASFRSV